jgi:Ca2+/Na+ antiporter
VKSSKSSNIGIIAGAAIGGCFLVVLLLLAVVYGFRQKNKARRATKKSNLFGKITLCLASTIYSIRSILTVAFLE